jgi:hypothetical protein
MITKKGCLKCHGHQGYKVGDIRGGVSVSVPMTPYLINQQRQTITVAVSLGLLWLLGVSGLVCKKIRDDKGYWDQLEAYIQKHSTAEFSHGICPECAKKYYPDIDLYDEDEDQG